MLNYGTKFYIFKKQNGESMEKWEDRKKKISFHFLSLVGGEKVERLKTLLFGWWEKWENKKDNLYKLTYMSLFKIKKEKRVKNHNKKKQSGQVY